MKLNGKKRWGPEVSRLLLLLKSLSAVQAKREEKNIYKQIV
jgi:hypothetical protein